MTGFLGVIAILEIITGIATLAAAKAVFGEMEGLILVGFGFLTLAVLAGASSIVTAIHKPRADKAPTGAKIELQTATV
jgi:hypothetical protein